MDLGLDAGAARMNKEQRAGGAQAKGLRKEWMWKVSVAGPFDFLDAT